MQARIAHVQPTTGSSICEDGKKTCTQFFVKTSVDFIMPTSRSNENRHWGYQLNSSFSKILYYTRLYFCFSPAFSGSRPRAPGPGPRDLDSCNLILLLTVICILSHKTFVWAPYPSDWRFLLRCLAEGRQKLLTDKEVRVYYVFTKRTSLESICVGYESQTRV